MWKIALNLFLQREELFEKGPRLCEISLDLFKHHTISSPLQQPQPQPSTGLTKQKLFTKNHLQPVYPTGTITKMLEETTKNVLYLSMGGLVN